MLTLTTQRIKYLILQIWISKHQNLKIHHSPLLPFLLHNLNKPLKITILNDQLQLSLKIIKFRCHQLLKLIWKLLLVSGLKIKLNPIIYSIWRNKWVHRISQTLLWSKMDNNNIRYLMLELFMKVTILLWFIIIIVIIIMQMDLKILNNIKMKWYLQINNLRMVMMIITMETVKNSLFQDLLTKI